MTNIPRRLRIAVLLCLALPKWAAAVDPAGKDTPPREVEVRVYGALRAIFHEGRTGPSVTLDTMLPSPDLYAVGALAGLSGEVTVVGGKAYLSYPDGDTTLTMSFLKTDAAATLLVAANVPA